MVGKIISLNKKSITVENNYMGYVIVVANPEEYEIGKIKKVFIYKITSLTNKNKLIEELYGFETFEKKDFFMKLLLLDGIGPKTAIGICAYDFEMLKGLIIAKDVAGITAIGISNKIAELLIRECDNFNIIKTKHTFQNQLIHALKSLGYEKEDIEYSVKSMTLNESTDFSDLISIAIKKIAEKDEKFS
jgi:Holliday junction DNA helicase RuvA